MYYPFMAKKEITEQQIEVLRTMRMEGCTILDIRRATHLGASVIHKYTKDIVFTLRLRKARMRKGRML